MMLAYLLWLCFTISFADEFFIHQRMIKNAVSQWTRACMIKENGQNTYIMIVCDRMTGDDQYQLKEIGGHLYLSFKKTQYNERTKNKRTNTLHNERDYLFGECTKRNEKTGEINKVLCATQSNDHLFTIKGDEFYSAEKGYVALGKHANDQQLQLNQPIYIHYQSSSATIQPAYKYEPWNQPLKVLTGGTQVTVKEEYKSMPDNEENQFIIDGGKVTMRVKKQWVFTAMRRMDKKAVTTYSMYASERPIGEYQVEATVLYYYNELNEKYMVGQCTHHSGFDRYLCAQPVRSNVLETFIPLTMTDDGLSYFSKDSQETKYINIGEYGRNKVYLYGEIAVHTSVTPVYQSQYTVRSKFLPTHFLTHQFFDYLFLIHQSMIYGESSKWVRTCMIQENGRDRYILTLCDRQPYDRYMVKDEHLYYYSETNSEYIIGKCEKMNEKTGELERCICAEKPGNQAFSIDKEFLMDPTHGYVVLGKDSNKRLRLNQPIYIHFRQFNNFNPSYLLLPKDSDDVERFPSVLDSHDNLHIWLGKVVIPMIPMTVTHENQFLLHHRILKGVSEQWTPTCMVSRGESTAMYDMIVCNRPTGEYQMESKQLYYYNEINDKYIIGKCREESSPLEYLCAQRVGLMEEASETFMPLNMKKNVLTYDNEEKQTSFHVGYDNTERDRRELFPSGKVYLYESPKHYFERDYKFQPAKGMKSKRFIWKGFQKQFFIGS